MTTIQKYIAGAIALLLLLGLAYCSGKKAGQIAEKLSANHTQIVANDSVTKLVTSAVDSARRRDSVLSKRYDVARTKVRVVHDSVLVGDTVYVSSDIAQTIVTADSTIAAQKKSLYLQDTLIASLRAGIALRNVRIDILESQGPSRISRGIQVGVGYCQTATSRTPCAYLGYGFTLRL